MAAKDIEAGRAHVLVTIRDRMTQGLKLAERKLQNFGRYVATSAGVVTAGIGAGLAWPIKLAANMEQTQTSFEVFLGSAEAARKKLAEIEQTAAETPFTFDQLKDAAQTLLQFGVSADALMPTMRNLGDVSGGDAEKFSRLALAFGQVNAKGRLMGQEVNQMVEAGFNPLAEISRTTGRSMAELSTAMEAGEISSRMLAMAFQSAAGTGGWFNGLMVKQSQTLIGLFSTLVDNAAMVGRAFGNAIMPALKTFVQVGISVSKFLTDFVKNNGDLVAIMGKVALVVGGVSGGFMAIGVAAMAGSFAVGLMASGFAAVFAAIGFLFSPLALIVAALVGLGAVAYRFREPILKAMADVAASFKGPIESLKNTYAIFMQTFRGILAALQSGQINAAGRILWLGFKALAFEAAVGVGNALLIMIQGIESLVPATAGVKDYMVAAFAGIGQALMAGNWGLAAQIAMAKIGVAVLGGWGAVTSTWDNAIATLGMSWDVMVFGIAESFRAAMESILRGLQKVVGVAERVIKTIAKLRNPGEMALELAFPQLDFQAFRKQVAEGIVGSLAVPIANFKGNAKSLGDAFTPPTAEANRSAFAASTAARNADNAAAQKKRDDQLALARQGIAAMEAQASKNIQGGPQTFQGKAGQARDALQKALDDARKEREQLAANGAKLATGPMALAGSEATKMAGGRGSGTTGTFSAIASALGNRTNGAAESTAKNTGLLVRLAKQQLQKPQPGLAP